MVVFGFGLEVELEVVLGFELDEELLDELLDFFALAAAACFFLSRARRAAASLLALIRAASFFEVELDFLVVLVVLGLVVGAALATCFLLSVRGAKGPQLAKRRLVKMSPVRRLGENMTLKSIGLGIFGEELRKTPLPNFCGFCSLVKPPPIPK